MNMALAATALLMGLAGAPHCTAMCGAACAGLVRGCGPGQARSAMWSLLAARLASYAVGGALVAASVSWLNAWSAQVAVLRPLWGMLQFAALLLGLWLLWRGRQPAWLQNLGRTAVQPAGRVVWFKGPARAAAAGSLWVALPCGLLQSALVVAALGSGPLEGATTMAVFALGSGVGLWVGPGLWLRWVGTGGLGVAQAATVRLAGLALAGAAAWALWHGMATHWGLDFCL
jgi:sulfite exporter TauE/SafE